MPVANEEHSPRDCLTALLAYAGARETVVYRVTDDHS
jgi:hypothetical protein